MQTTEYIIELNGVHLYAYHGVIEQERSIGAWYTINASFTISDFSCLENDSIEGTVSYADIYDTICEEMKSLRSCSRMYVTESATRYTAVSPK